jgi:cell wall-associated NlpC family hydrolase
MDTTTGAADQDKTAKKKQQSLESYHSLQDQLAKNFTQDQLDRMEQEYQARVNRINSEFDLREARANSFQKEAIRFERQISDIELKRQKALLDASAEVIKAQGSVAGGAGANLASGGGFSTAQLQKASSEASRFTGIANMCSESVKAFYKSLGISLPGVTAWADTVRNAGQTMTDWSKLQAGDIVATGRPGDTPHVGVYTGGDNVFHQSRKRGLKAGNYPDLDYFKSGYFVRPNAMDAGAPRKVTGDEKRDVIADQKAQLAVAQQSLTVRLADAQAVRDAAVAWAQYTAAIVPVEEQALQNDILAKKNELVKASIPEDVIEKEMKYFEAQQKTTLARAANDKLLKDGLIDEKQHAKNLSELQTRLANYNVELDKNIQLQRQQSFDASMTALNKQMELAGIIDPRAELRARISQEKPGYTPGQVEEEAAAQERIAQLEASRDRIRGIASSIGDAFGTAFKGIVTGSMTAQEALAGFFQSIADSFADMVAKMIAEWLKAQLIKGFMSLFPGGSALAGLNPTAAGGDWMGAVDRMNPTAAYANGGIAAGGFTAFANGGMVTGPTMGLVGEGRYNEAIVPLPDGKSIPVELAGGGSSSPTVIVNVDAKGSQVEGNEQNANQLGRVISAAVQTELIKQQRPGGLLAR